MSNNVIEEDHPSIISPQPIHHRTSSYGEKSERPRGRLTEESFPPAPVRTPGLDDSTPPKPYLNRSNTSNYLSELKNRTGKDKDRPILSNASSVSDAYHLQQRRSSGEDTVNQSMESLAPVSSPFKRNKHPERHSGLLNHPPSFHGELSPQEKHVRSSDTTRLASISNQFSGNFNNQASHEEEDVVNDVNQFKRKLSWWSRG